MQPKTKTLLAAAVAVLAAIALVVVIAATGGGDDKTSAAGNATDAAFIADMTAHHQGAIETAKVARNRGEHPQVRAMAGDVISAQQSEISVMGHIRDDMHAMGMDDGGHMGMSQHDMGMDLDMDMLRDAKPFDRAFIDMMVPHHEGAIRMAREELDKGKQPALHKMAKDIIAAQTREIAQMKSWRKRWYGSASRSMHDGSGRDDDSMMGQG